MLNYLRDELHGPADVRHVTTFISGIKQLKLKP